MARIAHRIEPSRDQLRTVEGGQTLKYPVNLVAEEIRKEAQKRGIGGNTFIVRSGYRSVAQQEILWRRALEKYGSAAQARKYVAPPGNSAHHTGGAIDFDLGLSTCCSKELIPEYRKTKAYKFLQEVAPKYKLSPYDAEPWHWECDAACEQNILDLLENTGDGSAFSKISKTAKYAGLTLGFVVLGLGSFLLVKGFD